MSHSPSFSIKLSCNKTPRHPDFQTFDMAANLNTLAQAVMNILRLYSSHPPSTYRSRTDAKATVSSIIEGSASLYNKVNAVIITFWTAILVAGVIAWAYSWGRKKRASPRASPSPQTAVAPRATRATQGRAQGSGGTPISHMLPDTPSVRDFVTSTVNSPSKVFYLLMLLGFRVL